MNETFTEEDLLPQGEVYSESDFVQGQPEVYNAQDFSEFPGMRAMEDEVKEHGLLDKFFGRLFGTDVEDPLEYQRMATGLAGAIGGGKIGSKMPVRNAFVNPVTGAIGGGAAGLFMGLVEPEATMEFMEKLNLVEEGYREEHGLSDEDFLTMLEGEALIEIATVGATTGIRALGRSLAKGLTGMKAADMKLAGAAKSMGVDLAPFQLGERGLGRGIINVMGRFPILNAGPKEVSNAVERAVKMYIDEAPSRIANVLSASEVGYDMWKRGNDVFKTVDARFGSAYSNLAKQANRAGVFYKPKGTRAAARQALARLKAERTATEKIVKGKMKEGLAHAGASAELVIKHLEDEEYAFLGTQTFGQMDQMIRKLDDFILSVDPEHRNTVRKFLEPVTAAAKLDLYTTGVGDAAKNIGKQRALLDADYSATMREFFENSAARRWETVQHGGLKTKLPPSEQATQIPTDRFMEFAVDMNSREVMDQLARLMPKDTYKAMASEQMRKILASSLTEVNGMIKIHPDKLRAALGIMKKKVPTKRGEAVHTMLTKADSPIKRDELYLVLNVMDKLAETPVPNWSTFVARRAMLGGWKSLFTMYSLGGAGSTMNLISALTFFGGSKAIIDSISNPLNARLFKTVISEEAKAGVRKAAWLRLVNESIQGGQEAAEYGIDTAKQVFEDAKEFADGAFGEDNGN